MGWRLKLIPWQTRGGLEVPVLHFTRRSVSYIWIGQGAVHTKALCQAFHSRSDTVRQSWWGIVYEEMTKCQRIHLKANFNYWTHVSRRRLLSWAALSNFPPRHHTSRGKKSHNGFQRVMSVSEPDRRLKLHLPHSLYPCEFAAVDNEGKLQSLDSDVYFSSYRSTDRVQKDAVASISKSPWS